MKGLANSYNVEHKQIYLFLRFFFLSNHYTQCGTQIYNPKIKSCLFDQLSQPSPPYLFFMCTSYHHKSRLSRGFICLEYSIHSNSSISNIFYFWDSLEAYKFKMKNSFVMSFNTARNILSYIIDSVYKS